MSVLSSYLVRQNIFLLLVMLLAGTSIYILTDLFERIDEFIEGSTSLVTIALFFLAKVPSIISQLLPAIFLLAATVQLFILGRNHEIIALQAGGVSPLVFLRFFLLYGVFIALCQLTFSQFLGAQGERYATRLWNEEIRGKTRQNMVRGLWFTEGSLILHIDSANAVKGEGTGLTAFDLSPDGLALTKIIEAEYFTIGKGNWVLHKGTLTLPESFSKDYFDSMNLPLKENLKAFIVSESSGAPSRLPLWELGTVIEKRKAAGSNVEGLRTAWHNKIAYAASIIVVGLFALAISRATNNIFRAVVGAVLFIFVYHSANTFCLALGEKGILHPALAAWAVTLVNFCLVLGWLGWGILNRRLLKMR